MDTISPLKCNLFIFSSVALCKTISVTLCWTLSRCVPVVHVLRSPKLESLFQVLSHKGWIERNSHFPWCADCFDSETQIAVGLLGMDTSLVHSGLIHQDPTLFYAKLFSSQSVPQPVPVHGVTPAQSAPFAFSLC